jgi:hypothetical protein
VQPLVLQQDLIDLRKIRKIREHFVSKTTFNLLRALNSAPVHARTYKGDSHVFPSKVVAEYFASDRLTDRFIRALVANHVIQWKEILEAFEFFELTRKYVRRPSMADVCCGHGLIGVLFAMLEKEAEDVLLANTGIPKSTARLTEVAEELAPWTRAKLRVRELAVTDVDEEVAEGTSVLSSHGCGALTDQAIDLAIGTGGPVAVMPCCCHPRSPEAPDVLYRELGIKDGVDVHRTYRLNDAGYEVFWRYIPEDITPMNRIIIGKTRV